MIKIPLAGPGGSGRAKARRVNLSLKFHPSQALEEAVAAAKKQAFDEVIYH
jgi:hypothetical protein